MCVDKDNFKCCSCIDLTTATGILGALYIIGCIYYGCVGEWAEFAFALVISALFVMVCVKPHDTNVRKLLFYIISTLSCLGLFVFIIVVIVVAA